MFFVKLTYVKPVEEVDKHLEPHRAFLRKYFASGNLVLAGRQVPRVGGVMIGVAGSTERMWEILREDPFYSSGVAEYEVTEFGATMLAEGLDALNGK